MRIKKIQCNSEVIAEPVVTPDIDREVEVKDELSPFTTSRKAIMKAISELHNVANNKPDYADKAKEAIANLSVIYFDLAE